MEHLEEPSTSSCNQQIYIFSTHHTLAAEDGVPPKPVQRSPEHTARIVVTNLYTNNSLLIWFLLSQAFSLACPRLNSN